MIAVIVSKERLEELRDATINALSARLSEPHSPEDDGMVSMRAVHYEIHLMVDKIMRSA